MREAANVHVSADNGSSHRVGFPNILLIGESVSNEK